MVKILFVCHGNICRSPMAEYVMKDLVKELGIAERYEISSAATSTEEIGNPVYPPAKAKLAEHGIRCKGHHARQMTRDDYEYYDFLIFMDKWNLLNARRFIGLDKKHKASMLLDHCGRQGGQVADPWYTGDFDATWDDVVQGCTGLIDEIEQGKDF
jgi:protein-tyrosine phosphatase